MLLAVRLATEADTESLFAIRTSVKENYQSRVELAQVGVTSESVREMLRTDARAWICEVDEIDAGFSMAAASEATIFALFVRPEFENRGIGRALLAAAESWLFEQGATEIWLTTGADAVLRANGFYRHLGWSPISTLPDDGQLKYLKYAPLA